MLRSFIYRPAAHHINDLTLILTIALRDRYYYPHCTGERTKNHTVQVTWPRSHKSGQCDAQVLSFILATSQVAYLDHSLLIVLFYPYSHKSEVHMDEVISFSLFNGLYPKSLLNSKSSVWWCQLSKKPERRMRTEWSNLSQLLEKSKPDNWPMKSLLCLKTKKDFYVIHRWNK